MQQKFKLNPMYELGLSRPDFAWLNPESRLFLQRGYIENGQVAEERIEEIAKYAEKILKMPGFADKFITYMKRGFYSLSSPVWANFGTTKGLSISCYGSFLADDTEEILDTVAEVGIMSKLGGGTSGYFGKIRPRGSAISNGGTTDGSFNFAKLFDTTISTISQGATRRGMMAGYIDVSHGDIHEWLNIHTVGNPIQEMYYGVCVSSQWLEEARNGDKQKQQLWGKILKQRKETGIPYIFFTDNANLQKPDVYKDKNMEIFASNLCVSGSTKILTKEYGDVETGSVVGEKLTVWNGEEWSENVEIVQTAKNQKLYRVTATNGKLTTSVDCTKYHKWYDEFGKMHQTAELYPGLVLEPFYSPDCKLQTFEIISVEELDGFHDTFCCNEPKRHKVVFNGVMTGNCSEIMLPSSTEESFVCCLASMNALYFEEWKNTDAVKILTYFLDAMITDFVQKTKKYKHMHKARRFAERHRALGVGVLGWHSFLQSQMIPFVSEKASEKTEELFGFLQAETLQASKELAELLGEPEILKGYGRRNATLMALAPTKSSSFILGSVSPSIEPLTSNYYVKDLAKIKSIFKNPYLEKLLDEKGKNTEEVWESILKFDGSVQHLDFLSDFEKDVFKTFVEIDVDGLIEQAALRQKYIDQGQSLNVMINPKTDPKEINRLYLKMHDLGLKSVYYQKGMNAAQVQNREKLQQTLVKPKDLSQETCSSCEA